MFTKTINWHGCEIAISLWWGQLELEVLDSKKSQIQC